MTATLSRQGMTKDLRRLCAEHGFTEVALALHVDDGKSGAIRDRPAFRAWLAATEGRADVLMAWRVDRLSRAGINVAASILDVVEGKDPATGKADHHKPVRLIGYDDRLGSADGDDSFRMNFVIKAELARSESKRNEVAEPSAGEADESRETWNQGVRGPNGAPR